MLTLGGPEWIAPAMQKMRATGVRPIGRAETTPAHHDLLS
jgi:hypothetical protein